MSTHWDHVRAFFLGNGPELEDLPHRHSSKQQVSIKGWLILKESQNKYGGFIQTSGTLHVRLEILNVTPPGSEISNANVGTDVKGPKSAVGIKESLGRARIRLKTLKAGALAQGGLVQ